MNHTGVSSIGNFPKNNRCMKAESAPVIGVCGGLALFIVY